MAAAALVIAAAAVLPLLAATPASADIVRQRQQWVLDAMNVPAAWRITQGRGVLVAVIDSGVDPTIADLKARGSPALTLPGSTRRSATPTGVPTAPGWRR